VSDACFLSRQEIMRLGINEGQPNISFNPTRASESVMLKLRGFCYVVVVALARSG